MIFYKDILLRSWKITWRHTVLWMLGIFVWFWFGKGIEFDINTAKKISSENSPFNPAFWDMTRWRAFFENSGFSTDPAIFWGLVLVSVILFVVVVFMIIISYGGMIHGFAQYTNKENSSRYTLHDAYVAGKKHLFTLLSINLFAKGIHYTSVGIAAAPLFFSNSLDFQIIWAIIVIWMIIPINILVSIIARFASTSAQLEGTDFVAAYKKGYLTFKKNIGVSLELAVLLFVSFFIIVNVLVATSAAIVTLPSLFLYMAEAPALFGLPWDYLHDRFFRVAFIVILYLFSILFSVWHVGSWTLLFQELQKGAKKSKVHRWIKNKKIAS